MNTPLCACGCNQEIDASKSRGEPRQFYSPACKQRHWRNLQKNKDNDKRNAPVQLPVTKKIKPILKYPGAKWSRASWIVKHFPEHTRYLEPYAGSAAAFFSKDPVSHEVLGDTNHHLINLFQVIQFHSEELAYRIALTGWIEEEYHLYEREYGNSGDPIEDARRFLIRCWQAHGTKLGSTCGWRHKGVNSNASTTALWRKLPERLLAVVDRLKDAEIRNRPALELIDYYRHPECLIYVDPPYMLSTRTYNLYPDEMTDAEHLQ